MPWEHAWEITQQTLAYTNHTLLPEALEKWSVPLMEKVLPRHMQIIFNINHRFPAGAAAYSFLDGEKLRKMSIIEEGYEKQVRMAHLCIVGSHAVNGVSALHSELLVKSLVPEFAQLWPEKFSNKTNGVAPRRWLMKANAGLTDLISRPHRREQVDHRPATSCASWSLTRKIRISFRRSRRSSARTSCGWQE